MHLKVSDAARLLEVDPDTVLRWIKEKGLPAHRLREQFYVNSVELQEWALANHVRMAPPPEEENSRGEPGADIIGALERGGVHAGVSGATREEVLASMVRLPGIPDRVDRDMLLQLLLAREMLGSTGVGGGIAIPHPRTPLVLDVEMPSVAVACYLPKPIDFRAVDGKPVWMLFLLLSPTIPDHLRLLAQLSWALHDRELRRLLEQRAPRDSLLARLRAMRLGGEGAR
jgi:nitrogen PTS system EIIA component